MLAASMYTNRRKRNRKENEIVIGKGKREEHHLSTFNGKPNYLLLSKSAFFIPERKKKNGHRLTSTRAAVMTR